MKFLIIFGLVSLALAKDHVFNINKHCKEPEDESCLSGMHAHIKCGMKIQQKYSQIVDAEGFDSDTLTIEGEHKGEEFSFTITIDAVEGNKDEVEVSFMGWNGQEMTMKFVRVSTEDLGLPAEMCKEMTGKDSVDIWIPKHEKIQKKIRDKMAKMVKKHKAGEITEEECKKAKKQMEKEGEEFKK